MTLFSTIWLFMIAWGMCKKDIRYMMTLTIMGMILQCNNVIQFNNDLTVGPQMVTSAAFVVKSLMYKRTYRLKRRSPVDRILIFLFVWILLNVAVIKSQRSDSALYVLQLGLYLVTFLQMEKLAGLVDKKYFSRLFCAFVWVIIIVGAIQLTIEVLNLPKNTIFAQLVYNDTRDPNICYHHKNVKRFYSTFMEPSFAAPVLVGPFFLLMESDKQVLPKMRNILIVVLGICILMTKSSTAFGSFAICAALFALRNIKSKKVWLMGIAGTGIVTVLMLGTDLFDKVIFNKMQSGSGVVRANMNRRAMSAFRESPILGMGYKSVRGSSIVPTMLGELGIIGAAIYLTFLLYLFAKTKNRKGNISRTKIGTVYMIIAACLSQVIACPDLDLCSFWVSLYLFAIASHCKQSE